MQIGYSEDISEGSLVDIQTRPLVFVVGAGANKDFGETMPVGSELAVRIEAQLNQEFSHSTLDGPIKTAILRSPTGLSGAHTNAANRIRASLFAQASIDDLLNEWRDTPEMLQVGKMAIAHAILEAERDCALGVTGTGDANAAFAAISSLRSCWLAYLLRNLQQGRSRRELEHVFSNVGFITFNYDRCIEQYLYWAFQNVAGYHSGNAALAVGRIPIIHVYGSLGRLPYVQRQSLDVPFGSEEPVHQTVWQRIKTYTEEDHDKENLAAIHALFRNAATVVFLGMGFHERNMSLLLQSGDIRADCKVWGTMQGLSLSRQAQVRSCFDHPTRPSPQFLQANCQDLFTAYGPSMLGGL